MNHKRILLLAGLILVAALTRLLPHPPNFTAIGAIALFGGAYLSDKRWAFLIPLAAMLISDLFLGFHQTMIYVYAAFMLIICIGFLLRSKISVWRVGGAAIGSSVLFYLITNFGVWLGGTLYPLTWEGLVSCYVAAIPFFRYTLLSNLIFSGVLFGVFEFLKFQYPVLKSRLVG